MARVSFGKASIPPVRSPLSPGVMKELTANPMEAAAKQLKASQMPPPQVPKFKLPKPPRKPNQFFGE
jgi:hypothetical protein